MTMQGIIIAIGYVLLALNLICFVALAFNFSKGRRTR